MKEYGGGDYRPTHSLLLSSIEMSGQHHAPAALAPEKCSVTNQTGGCVGSRRRRGLLEQNSLSLSRF